MPNVKWFADAARARELLAFGRLSSGERVLEVGCGPGFILAEATAAGRLVGVDVSPMMLASARERAPTARLVRAAVEHLPFVDRTFDLAVCRSVLHHALNPASMVREMARVVRIGGRVVVNDSVSSEEPREAANHNRMERLRDPSHGRMVPPSELLDLFSQADLRVGPVRAHRYTRELEAFLDIASPPSDARAKIVRLFTAWASKDESGLLVRTENGRIQFDHTQWTILGTRR